MAQSPDQMFRLDPREVKVVAPVSEFTAQTNTQVVDTRIADKSRSRGFSDLGTSILNAGIQKKNEQIVEDTRIAQEAAAREEVMPGGLYPIAQQAYRDAIDINTSHATLLEAKNWTEGTEYTNILKDKNLQHRQKTDALKNHLTELKKKALGTLQNPQVIQKLSLEFDELIATNEKIIYEYEKDQRDLTIIEAGTNTVLSAVSFAKRGELLWDTVFTPRFLKNMITDVLKIAPDMLPAEAKILSFKIIANNPDLLGRPSVMRKLLSTEFSDGISFATLLSKGSVPNRTTGKIDPDAKQFAAVWTEYQQNSKAYSASIVARNKELKEIRDTHINEVLLGIVKRNGGRAEAIAALKSLGVVDISTFNTTLNGFEKFNESAKAGIDSEKGQAFEKSLAGTNATAAEVKLAMIRHGISLDNADYYQTIASVENTQVKIVRDAHTAAIKIVKSQTVSMLKGALSGKTLYDVNGEINRAALKDIMLTGKKLNSAEVLQVLEGLQAIDLEFASRASKTARSVAANDNLMDTGELVNKFQNNYFETLEKFIKGVQEGNLIAPASSTGEPTADKETSTGTPTTIEKPTNPIVEQHEVLKKLTPETIEEQKKTIAEDFKASIGEQGKNKLNKPVYTLNSKDEEYYKTLEKGMSEEQTKIVAAQKLAQSIASVPVDGNGLPFTGEDIFNSVAQGLGLITKDTIPNLPKSPEQKSRTGLGPIVDAVDSTVGAVVDWLQDKPQTKHEIESTVKFLDIFNKGTNKIKSSFLEFQSNRAKAKGQDTTERLLRTPERTPMESTPPIPMKEIVVQDTKPATKLPTVTPNKAYIESQKQKDLVSITKKVAEESNLDSKLLDILFKLESSGGKQLINIPKKGKKATTAKGAGQIIDATAKSLAKRLNTTPDKIQNDTETNVRATALLFTDALERYKDTNDPVIFAFADHHGGSPVINTARRKATNKNDIESVIKQLEITVTKENTYQETIDFIRKAQKELNR